MLVAAAPLAVWGVWGLWTGVQGQQWAMGLLGVVAVSVAGGLLLLKAWAKYLAYVFAAGLALRRVYAVWLAVAGSHTLTAPLFQRLRAETEPMNFQAARTN